MPISNILEQLKQKGADFEKIVNQVMDNSELIPELVNVINTEKGSIKFGCEKVLRLISEQNPILIYPYFDFYVTLLDSDNTFLKCGAILTIANLVSVDDENHFENAFAKYYSQILGSSLICAANVIGSSVKIALSKPELVDKIVNELLKVEKAKYKSKGVFSPECNKVACGQALNTLEQIYDKITDREPVINFVKRQLNSTRKPVVKSAEKFLKSHQISF